MILARPGKARAAALLATLAALSAGCGEISKIGPETCDRSADGNKFVDYKEGTVENGVYMSSGWDGDGEKEGEGLLYFPGGMRYKIFHQLGAVPRWWQIYLSFDRYGTATGTLAQATGNQAEVLEVDAGSLEIANGSCVEYWLLVVAGAGDGDGEPAPEAAEDPPPG